MGAGRSGSTVLNIMLGSHPEIFGAGELQNLGRALANNEYCSCGDKIKDCSFWSKVYSNWIDSTQEVQFNSAMTRIRKVENLKSPLAWIKMLLNYPGQSKVLEEYFKDSYLFFNAITTSMDQKVITDISKNPLRALGLLKKAHLDLRLIHLVRDGRALAWSLFNVHEVNKKLGVEKELKPRPIWRTAAFWLIINWQSNLVRKRSGKVVIMKYEELTKNPEKSLRKLESIIDLDLQPIIRNIQEETPLPIAHVMSGNKLRMSKSIKLRYNDDWRRQMAINDQKKFYNMTRRTMSSFGYSD